MKGSISAQVVEDYSGEAFDSYHASHSKRTGSAAKREVEEFKKKMKEEEERRKSTVNEFLKEL